MKYDVGGTQGQYQPGSNDRVLANKLDITDPCDMNDAELVLLEKLYEDVLLNNLSANAIKISDIKNWHRRWLGNVYDWAGEERTVNLSKGGFQFAAAPQIPKLLSQFEQGYLNKYTPCTGYTDLQLIEVVAITHIEFILIHPFRENNGRLSRLLADVMVAQAGYQPLDYTLWDKNKEAYFSAIQQGVSLNYEPMKEWVSRILLRS